MKNSKSASKITIKHTVSFSYFCIFFKSECLFHGLYATKCNNCKQLPDEKLSINNSSRLSFFVQALQTDIYRNHNFACLF